MQKNPFLNRIMKTKKADILHSSAYVQNKSSVGATSSISFDQRMAIDKERKTIGKYKESKLVSDAFLSAPRPKTYKAPKNKMLSDNKNDLKGAERARYSLEKSNLNHGNIRFSSVNQNSNSTPNPPMWKNPGISR